MSSQVQNPAIAVVPQTKATGTALMSLPPSDARDLLVMGPSIFEMADNLKKEDHTAKQQFRMMLAAQSYQLDMRVANMLFYIVKDKVSLETTTMFQLAIQKYPDATFEYVDEAEFYETDKDGKRAKVTVGTEVGVTAVMRAGKKGKVRSFKYTLEMLKSTPRYKLGVKTAWEKGNSSMVDFPDDHLIKKCARLAFKRAFPELEAAQGFEEEYAEVIDVQSRPVLEKKPAPALKKATIADGPPIEEVIPEPELVAQEPPVKPAPPKRRRRPTQPPTPTPTPAPAPQTPVPSAPPIPKPAPPPLEPKPKLKPKPQPTPTSAGNAGELDTAHQEMMSAVDSYYQMSTGEKGEASAKFAKSIMAYALSTQLPKKQRPEKGSAEELALLPAEIDNLSLGQARLITNLIVGWLPK